MYSTIEIVPFQASHGLWIDVADSDAAWMSSPSTQFHRQAMAGPAYTMLINGRVAAIGGVVEIWSGLGEAWFVATKESRKKPVAMTRHTGRFIDYIVQSLGIRRLQCHVKTSDTRAIKWAMHMGFAREATLRRYGADGSDYDLMAIVR